MILPFSLVKTAKEDLEPYIKMVLVSDNDFPTSKKYKTKAIKRTSEPTWNETFDIPISDLEGEKLLIKCWVVVGFIDIYPP